jgi:putative glycosyltransferase (TIGR04372 family)
MIQFIARQVKQIHQGGITVLLQKIDLLLGKFYRLPFYFFAIPVVLIIRLIKPWLIVRMGILRSTRLGHFAANTELYLCEQEAGINKPNQRHIDIFCFAYGPVCNRQLALMWKRVLRILPSFIVAPIVITNRLIPGGNVHEVGNNSQHDRDIHNLLDRSTPHLQFTAEEESLGLAGLQAIGLPFGAKFVCLNVRDSAYLSAPIWDFHNYRDSDVQNYVLAAEALAERGYFVIRMGAKVHAAINSSHPKVIDYATNGMRSDFMDIYLGSKCAFCLSTGTGWEAIPAWLFRRPICYVNHCPVGYLCTWFEKTILLSKRHLDVQNNRNLTFNQILNSSLGFNTKTAEYSEKGIVLIENTPEEIYDVAIEMEERLVGTWQSNVGDEVLQKRFREIYLSGALDAFQGLPTRGEIHALYSTTYLRNNKYWLE